MTQMSMRPTRELLPTTDGLHDCAIIVIIYGEVIGSLSFLLYPVYLLNIFLCLKQHSLNRYFNHSRSNVQYKK